MKKITPIARLFFCVALTVFGIQHLVYAHFGLEPFPGWLPAHAALAYIMGAVFIVVALAIAIRKMDYQAALLLGLLYLLNVLLLQIPRVIADLHNGNEWTGCFEALAIASSSLIIAGMIRGNRSSGGSRFSGGWDRLTASLLKAAPFLFAACLLVYAMLHFIYADYIATLIPSWIPLHLFLSYFIGFAFLASAVSITIKRQARLAALLMGLMFYTWVAILHLPRVMASPHNEAEMTSLCVALAVGSGALLLAGIMPDHT